MIKTRIDISRRRGYEPGATYWVESRLKGESIRWFVLSYGKKGGKSSSPIVFEHDDLQQAIVNGKMAEMEVVMLDESMYNEVINTSMKLANFNEARRKAMHKVSRIAGIPSGLVDSPIEEVIT